MSIEMMRKELSKLYGGSEKWIRKLCSYSADQITAVYFRFKKKGLL